MVLFNVPHLTVSYTSRLFSGAVGGIVDSDSYSLLIDSKDFGFDDEQIGGSKI